LPNDQRFLWTLVCAAVGRVELLERHDGAGAARGRPFARQEGVPQRLRQIRKLIPAA
jgi:hypothetical protein